MSSALLATKTLDTIDLRSRAVYRGQVWLANLGEQIGSIQAKIRPVLIVSNNKNNFYSSNITVVPLTSKNKKNIPTHVLLSNEEYLSSVSIALCEQVTVLDKRELIKYMGEANNEIMIEIDNALKIQMELRREFDHNKAFEMLDQIYYTNKLIKQFGSDPKLLAIKNFHIKNYKEYCSHYCLDINEIKGKYLEKKISFKNN